MKEPIVIRGLVHIDGGDRNSGCYLKIGFRWYRLEQLPPDEAAEAQSYLEQQDPEPKPS